MGETLLEIRNLSKIYEGRDVHVKALSDISLTVNRGETIGIVERDGVHHRLIGPQCSPDLRVVAVFVGGGVIPPTAASQDPLDEGECFCPSRHDVFEHLPGLLVNRDLLQSAAFLVVYDFSVAANVFLQTFQQCKGKPCLDIAVVCVDRLDRAHLWVPARHVDVVGKSRDIGDAFLAKCDVDVGILPEKRLAMAVYELVGVFGSGDALAKCHVVQDPYDVVERRAFGAVIDRTGKPREDLGVDVACAV